MDRPLSSAGDPLNGEWKMSEILDNTYPLTAAQSGMWFAQFLDPTNPSFWVAECLEIHGPIDLVLFKGSSAPVERPLPRRTSPHASTAPREKAREDAPS
jgi:hypothetical protein